MQHVILAQGAERSAAALLDWQRSRLAWGSELQLGGLATVGVRDEWIGWSEATRAARLPRIALNSRFLILPTVQVPHLASHVLGLATRQLAGDWQQRYDDKPVLVETFVDSSRYRGTCYRAANWIDLRFPSCKHSVDWGSHGQSYTADGGINEATSSLTQGGNNNRDSRACSRCNADSSMDDKLHSPIRAQRRATQER